MTATSGLSSATLPEQHQAAPREVVETAAPRQQGHLVAGLAKVPGVDAADHASSHDQRLHRLSPSQEPGYAGAARTSRSLARRSARSLMPKSIFRSMIRLPGSINRA